MTAQSATFRGRMRAELLLTSRCEIYAVGDPSTDPDSGEVTRTPTTIWTGPCRVKPIGTGLSANAEALGGIETLRFDYRVSIPFEVSIVEEQMRLRILASPDPALVGLSMEIQRIDRGDSITARRLLCERLR